MWHKCENVISREQWWFILLNALAYFTYINVSWTQAPPPSDCGRFCSSSQASIFAYVFLRPLTFMWIFLNISIQNNVEHVILHTQTFLIRYTVYPVYPTHKFCGVNTTNMIQTNICAITIKIRRVVGSLTRTKSIITHHAQVNRYIHGGCWLQMTVCQHAYESKWQLL